jgi:hypothetical protein
MRCGGYCTGEWTRACSKNCPCIPRSWRGKNIVQAIGQAVGWATYSVEIKNITCGDLPFDDGRGDFYLSVETSTNPPMVTALQEEKLPKVVHFPEIMNLKIRDSLLERRVRICVKELNVIGSVDICDCFLSSTAILDWARDPIQENRVMRFQMRPCENTIERETPCWMLVEFAVADDVRGVDSLPADTEGGAYIRTWVPTDHASVRTSGAQPAAYHDGAKLGGSMWTNAPRQNVDLKVDPFKNTYQLLDDSGNPVQEPAESALREIRIMRKCALCLFGSFQCLVWLCILGYSAFRFYVWSCYRHFQWITIAKLRNATFPISEANLHIIVKACHEKFDGTGLSNGQGVTTALADACRPNSPQIIETCGALPPLQPRPEAFTAAVKEYIGIDMDHGPYCFDGICKFRNDLVEWDWTIAGIGVCMFLMTFVCKYCMNSCIKAARRNHQKQQGERQRRLVANP